MEFKKFATLVVVAVLLGFVVGAAEHHSVAGGFLTALKAALFVPVAIFMARVSQLRDLHER